MSMQDSMMNDGAGRAAWVKRAVVAAAAGVLVAVGCGGGGGGGSCSPSTDLTGNWSGPTSNDTVARGNPGVVNATFLQVGCDVTGTWTFDYQDSHLDFTRSAVGGAPESNQVFLNIGDTVESCDLSTGFCATVNGCIYDISGTLVSPTEIVGTYTTAQNCSQSQSGDFDLKFVSQLAPTATPIVLSVTATPAPTATPTPAP